MNANFIDEDGQARPMEMGCYGIGVTRIAGRGDRAEPRRKGIIWPRGIAPFEVVICPMGMDRSEAVRAAATQLLEQCRPGVDVILDDRGERPGVMFADWELIGVPLRLTVGDRGSKEGMVELTVRRGLSTDRCRWQAPPTP